MTDHSDERDDALLAAALRTVLEQRDRVVRPQRFATMWPGGSERGRSTRTWLPLAASVASVVAVAGLVWTSTHRPETRIDPSPARQLSSADYWRVPTDELRAYEAAPLHADLPTPTGLQISLEESLL
jgi:hypothetical protein